MSDFDFEINTIIESETKEDETYTSKIDIPQYQVKGDKPKIEDLVDVKKTEELMQEIEKSNISEEEKNFLMKAATRHYAFDYSNVAEYYPHACKEMQELMEKSALVIIDYKDAIKNGYAHISNEINEMSEEDYEK